MTTHLRCETIIQKESVEMISVYYYEGCGKTQTEINDTMPHTWTVWGRYAERVQPHSYTRNECYSFILQFRKLPHFHSRTAKTLSICLLFCNSTTKLKRIFETNNTHSGHCNIFMIIFQVRFGCENARLKAVTINL